MLVGEGVEYYFSLTPEFDQIGLSEDFELMGYCRLAGSGDVGDVTDTHLGYIEGMENLYSGGISKNLEKIAQIDECFFIWKSISDFFNNIIMDEYGLTLGYLCH